MLRRTSARERSASLCGYCADDSQPTHKFPIHAGFLTPNETGSAWCVPARSSCRESVTRFCVRNCVSGKSFGAPKGIHLTTFHDLGLSQTIVATLSALGFEKATPIQAKAIPLVMEGNDLIGLAQTGTGKTAAFGLPMIEKLLLEARRPDPRNIRALILAPTRELVNQIADNLRDFVKKTPLRVVTVVGGASINKQSEMLSRGTDILVATPGRLLDLVNRKSVTLTQARYLVLDEADQMLDLGFIHDLRKISKMVPKNRQT